MKISVVIPTYNRAALLVKTLDSIYAQTRPADEVIVVDDGSTDNTRSTVTNYPQHVIYQYQTNARPGAARNNGQRLSKGDAILFIDSDDLLVPTALETMEAALQANPEAALVYCRSGFIGSNDEEVEPLWGHDCHEGDVWKYLVSGNFIRSPGCALIRRTHLDRVGPWLTREQLGVNEDWEIWLRLAEAAPFVYLDEPLFIYRVQSDALSLSANELANYHWALVLLELQIERHCNDPEKLAVLAKAYDTFYEATEFRWRRAAGEAQRAWQWREIFECRYYLFQLSRRHQRNLSILAPFRKAKPVAETTVTASKE